MRCSVSLLVLAWLVTVPALAQPRVSFSHAAVVDSEVARIDTVWSAPSARRSARVTARIGAGPSVELHSGATVRVAVASEGGRLCLVVYHGGDDDPFARAILAHREGDHLVVDHRSTIPRDLALADHRPRFPAGALVAATPSGFAVMVQHQERDPTADVVTTLTVLGADGSEVEATHVVGVPWALGALVRDGDGYQLAVLWGGWSGHEGTARICLVHLTSEGSPTEHPWWASPFVPVSEPELIRTADGATTAAWLDEEGHVVGHRWTAAGGWSVEPPAPERLGTLPADAVAWTLVEHDGRVAVASAR